MPVDLLMVQAPRVADVVISSVIVCELFICIPSELALFIVRILRRTLLIRPPDVHVGRLIFYHRFFFLLSLFVRSVCNLRAR